MAIVLPDLLKTHDVRLQLVQPPHDLVSTLRPASPDERVNVELHDPQDALGHTSSMPEDCPIESSAGP
jgi:hypothetical protein